MINGIPIIRIVLMFFIIAVAFSAPFIVALTMKKKAEAKMPVFFIGMASFVIFGLLLSKGIYGGVNSLSGGFLDGDGVAPVLCDALIQSLCEELGRFAVMKFIMTNTLRKENSIMYGAGHGGLELMMNYGAAFVMLTVISFTSTAEEEIPLRDMPFVMFFIAPVLIMIPFMMSIGLSYLVFRSVKGKTIVPLVVAVLIHIICNTLIVVLSSEVVSTAIIMVIIIALFVFTVVDYRKEREEIN